MAYGDSFKQFLSDHNIGQIVTTTDGDPVIFVESAMVSILLKDRYAIDASEGGLVIGNFHFEGGVHMLQPFNDGFRYVGEMEGYEFLFSPDATFKYHEQIHQINQSTVNDKDLLPRKFSIPGHIKKIDLTNLRFHLIILSGRDSFIVNRAATEKNIELLNMMNTKSLWKRFVQRLCR